MSRRRIADRWFGRVPSFALAIAWGVAAAGAGGGDKAENDKQAGLRAQLKKLPYRIVYESHRGGDWDLLLMNADGSGCVNLTKAPSADDLYPHASPDGGTICFLVDEGRAEAKSRNLYTMGVDGLGRKLIARNARQPCWGPGGRRLAYLPGEFDRFTYRDYATKGLVVYDVKTGRGRPHPNGDIHHLYNLCWSPDGKWFTATVHGGMGHKHANLAFPAGGREVFKLPGVGGCRPDISPDGKRISWNATDHLIAVADLRLGASGPRVANIRKAVTCDKQHEVYHADWSPDGKYIVFSYGPKGGEQVGTMAKGWHICVADAAQRDLWVVLTTGGLSNKEPDWVPAGPPAPAADGEALSEKQLRLAAGLKKLPYRIVYETYRKDNWELFLMSADGSGAVNLTNTPDVHELNPHASPDGAKVCFVADEGRGKGKTRNVYVMNADGTGRTLVAANARQPCWGPGGRRLLYAKGEYDRFTYSSYGTKGLFFYDTASRRHAPHPNESLLHVTYLCRICVADAAETNVWVALTTGGESNKEPDWLPAASRASGR